MALQFRCDNPPCTDTATVASADEHPAHWIFCTQSDGTLVTLSKWACVTAWSEQFHD